MRDTMRTFPSSLILIFTAAEQRVNYTALSSVTAVPVQWRFKGVYDNLGYWGYTAFSKSCEFANSLA